MPKRTIELLEKLRGLGLSDDEFQILHHQSWATIESMIRYCRKTGSFRAGDNNHKVRERLEYILSALERQEHPAATTARLATLAQEAVRRIPFQGAGEMPDDEVLDDEAELVLRQRTDIGPTEVERLSKARRGQDVFRDNVRQIEKGCRVTRVDDSSFLIASHIKPWRDSNDAEKLDGYNGLLLAPHVDHLFDKGYISFEDDGRMLVAATLDPKILRAWGMQPQANVGRFADQQKVYLAHHRSEVFKDRDGDLRSED